MSAYNMSVDTTTGNTAVSGDVSTRETGNSSLSKDDFLKLLIAQMTHQDPTAPMDSGQMLTQMAQFSALEQTQNMSQSIDKMSAADMIGKQIEWEETETDDDGVQSQASKVGIVDAVTIKNGSVSYLTKDGDTVESSVVSKITEPAEAAGEKADG
ncbi:MAG: flagellar hook capping protein [Sporolactobacillus sp.]|jgi:flagellar basal-body rod modification protein FlgD|nr:flagellar hook capping protein [Sporolactobacillus sp.]MCI1882358.1 flagellar hook capping protein [Sporolactobacillus sp.]